MKRTTLLLTIGFLFTFSSCIREEIIIVEPPRPAADVDYSFYNFRYNVEIEGDILNTGNTFIKSTELRFQLFDERGHLVETYFEIYDVGLSPGDGTYFFIDLPERYIYDVQVDISKIW